VRRWPAGPATFPRRTDHQSIYSDGVDGPVAAKGLTILETRVRSPQANAFCERLIGTIRKPRRSGSMPLPDRLFVRCLACELGTLGRAYSRAFTIGARFL
jgi:transposase InsO family protein